MKKTSMLTSLVRMFMLVLSLMLLGFNAKATNYISDIMIGSACCDAATATTLLTNSGYTVCTGDMAEGTGGYYVYLGCKTSTNKADAITGVLIMSSKNDDYCKDAYLEGSTDSLEFDGKYYYLAKHLGGTGDLNEGAGKGTYYLNVYYTRNGNSTSSNCLTSIGTSYNESDCNVTMKGLESWDCANLNRSTGTSSANIYMHITRHTHSWNNNGFCGQCGEGYQPATLNNGVYEIANVGQLYWFANLVNNGTTGANAILTDNIVVNNDVLNADGTLNGDGSNFRSWTPIGTYTGTFNGKGHTISGLYFSESGTNCHTGLFGYIGAGGKVDAIGILSSYMKGRIAGGICGENDGTITNCYVTGNVEAYGYSEWSYGEEYFYDGYAGGVCGSNFGTITNSYSICSATGGMYVGGVCGANQWSGTISNCYCTCEIIFGFNNGSATNYSTKTATQFKNGEVAYLLQNGQTDQVWGQNVGTDTIPTLGGDKVTVARDYCDGSPAEYCNDCELNKTVIHKYENGFCYCGESIEPANYVDGTYEIANAGQLFWFASLVNDSTNGNSANAILTANIVVNSNVLNADGSLNGDDSNFKSWTPIGSDSKAYTGTFNGRGHTISGLYFNNSATDYVGLFGYVQKADITGVGLEDCYINGRSMVGSICGYSEGVISGENIEGGIVNCYNHGTVKGSTNVGGICGYSMTSDIANCYSSGIITGSTYEGAICGTYGNKNTVSHNCYYLKGTDGSETTIAKNAEQFASGEVTYLLQKDQTEQVWGQKLGTDKTPAFSSDVVYAVNNCRGELSGNFSNNTSETIHGGDDYVNGFCVNKRPDGTVCDTYQPAILKNGVYEIANAGQLYWFANLVNSGTTNANAVLTNNIIVNSNVIEADGSLNADVSNFRSWTPIGNDSKRYTGTFNGKGHTISGLYSNNVAYRTGFFGVIGGDGKVDSIGVLSSYMKGIFVGGVCGWNNGIISNCYNTGRVDAIMVEGDYDYYDGYGGGVCGLSDGTISNCYNTGSLEGEGEFGGGVCGVNRGTISNCYNLGSVINYRNEGGVCGENEATVSNCYYLASESNGSEAKTAAQFASGEVAYLLSHGDVDGSVWGQKIGTDITPVFGGEKVTGAGNYCDGSKKYCNGCEFVETISHAYVNGFCSRCKAYQPATLKNGVYEIANAGQLYWFASLVNDSTDGNKANAILIDDIVVNDTASWTSWNENTTDLRSWTPIGNETTSYSGSFNGKGHTISGLYYGFGYNAGLFGSIGEGGKVESVGVLASYINGVTSVGGLCGNNVGSICNCYNSGSVRGQSGVGGVCGVNRATISNCYNTGSVNGDNSVGGVCGSNRLTIINSYNTGSVSGNADYVGNVCGSNYGTVSYCYYLASESKGSDAKTADQFASGEVAILLQKYVDESGDATLSNWTQRIGDANPLFEDVNAIGGTGIQYMREKKSNNWGTICVPYAIRFSNATFYTVDKMDGDVLVLKVLERVEGEECEVEVVAGVPVIYYCAEDTLMVLVQEFGEDKVSYPKNDGMLKGVYEQDTISEGSTYYLKGDKFYARNGYFVVNPFKAYIELPAAPGAPRALNFMLSNETATGVDAVANDGATGDVRIEAIYNIKGQRVAGMQKGGIYILKMSDGSTKKVEIRE